MKVTVVLNAEQIERIKATLSSEPDFSGWTFSQYVQALAQAAVDAE